MSYLERRKDGQIFFVAEVKVGGQRLRKRFSSQREADQAEKRWKNGIGLPAVAPQAKASSLGFGDRVDDAVAILWGAKGTVPRWIICVRAYLRSFQDWAKNPHLDEIDKGMVDGFTVHLQATGKAPATTNAILRTVRKYLLWAHEAGLRGPVPRFTFRRGAGERTTVFDRPARDEVVAWFRNNASSPAMQPVYDAVADFWFVLFRTGCRRDELLSATPAQLRPSGLWLPKTKTHRERTIPLLPEVREVLARRLPWAISKTTLHNALLRCRKGLGVYKTPRDFVLHTARHTAATDLVERGADIRQVQELLGHASIVTTQRYVKVSPVKLAKIMEHLR